MISLDHAPAGHADEGLMLRPVDCRTTGTTKYDDPLHVDEAIAFYRVSLDPALRELNGHQTTIESAPQTVPTC